MKNETYSPITTIRMLHQLHSPPTAFTNTNSSTSRNVRSQSKNRNLEVSHSLPTPILIPTPTPTPTHPTSTSTSTSQALKQRREYTNFLQNELSLLQNSVSSEQNAAASLPSNTQNNKLSPDSSNASLSLAKLVNDPLYQLQAQASRLSSARKQFSTSIVSLANFELYSNPDSKFLNLANNSLRSSSTSSSPVVHPSNKSSTPSEEGHQQLMRIHVLQSISRLDETLSPAKQTDSDISSHRRVVKSEKKATKVSNKNFSLLKTFSHQNSSSSVANVPKASVNNKAEASSAQKLENSTEEIIIDYPFMRHLSTLFSFRDQQEASLRLTNSMLPSAIEWKVVGNNDVLPKKAPTMQVHVSPVLTLPPPLLNTNDLSQQAADSRVHNFGLNSTEDAAATNQDNVREFEEQIILPSSTKTSIETTSTSAQTQEDFKPVARHKSTSTVAPEREFYSKVVRSASAQTHDMPTSQIKHPVTINEEKSSIIPSGTKFRVDDLVTPSQKSENELLELVLRAFDLADDTGVETEWKARLSAEEDRQRQQRALLEAHAAEARAYQRELEERERNERLQLEQERKRMHDRAEDERRLASLVEAKVQERLTILEREKERELIEHERKKAAEAAEKEEAFKLQLAKEQADREKERIERQKEAKELDNHRLEVQYARDRNAALMMSHSDLEKRLKTQEEEHDRANKERERKTEEERIRKAQEDLAQSIAQHREEAEKAIASRRTAEEAARRAEIERLALQQQQNEQNRERERLIIEEMKASVERLRTERRELELEIAGELEEQRHLRISASSLVASSTNVVANDAEKKKHSSSSKRSQNAPKQSAEIENGNEEISSSESEISSASDYSNPSELSSTSSEKLPQVQTRQVRHRTDSIGEISAILRPASPGMIAFAPYSSSATQASNMNVPTNLLEPLFIPHSPGQYSNATSPQILQPPQRRSHHHPIHLQASSHHISEEELRSVEDLSEGELSSSGRHLYMLGKISRVK